ncbi:MAG: Rieske 2Fe-2S domain-containing protein [Alphaproteobacteria bacterium]|nr:Rieske 2Fe-2S domain-containing protein [Alphaproteobacteria bacterium]
MLSKAENERLTLIGPGTPAGELLRRYWQPVAASSELTDEKPITRIRILGEDLVLYRDTAGGYGLVGEQCPHRMASLAYGRVDDEGIRCPYHGWKFNAAGRCIETPAEDPGATLKDAVRHTAYPVEKLGGVLFAYMGPLPAPALPRWDVLAWEHGHRYIRKFEPLRCNWLQCMENSVDPSHLYWLHGDLAHLKPMMDDYEEKHDFIKDDYGIMKRRTTPPRKPGGRPEVDQHPLLFPNTLRHVSHDRKTGRHRHNLQFRMPIDDTHTQVMVCNFEPDPGVHTPTDADVPIEYFEFRTGENRDEYRMDMVAFQDFMAWETQGPIMDRSQEQLGLADKGVVELRRMLREQIDIVAAGGAPLNVVPADQGKPIIELEVINERIGLTRPETRPAA